MTPSRELDRVGPRLRILLCLKVVQGHPKLAQDRVSQVLQLAWSVFKGGRLIRYST